MENNLMNIWPIKLPKLFAKVLTIQTNISILDEEEFGNIQQACIVQFLNLVNFNNALYAFSVGCHLVLNIKLQNNIANVAENET